MLSVTRSALEAWRIRGTDPPLPYVRLGRLVRYRPEDVRAWVAARTHHTTSEEAAAATAREALGR